MGIHGGSLIKLCTLLCWAVDFCEVLAAKISPKNTTPTAVVDGNCWIYECACGIVSGLSAKSEYSSFGEFLRRYKTRLDYVKKCGWEIIIVFDGRRLPLKKDTHAKRESSRRKAAARRQTTAKVAVSDLSTFHPSHELIHRLVLSLQEVNHQVIVAPHEGDPQCAYFMHTGKAHIVITRDSDLIAHGCKCVFFWNSIYHAAQSGGYGGKLYWKGSLWRCADGLWKPILKLGWDAFLNVCVLTGTDYNVGVKNIAIKKAIKIVADCKTLEASVVLLTDPDRRMFRNAVVPEGFLAAARKAKLMFKHALVFDPDRNCVCHERDLPEGSEPLIEVCINSKHV